jgi:protocatechuate 3,4-dioxygenase alpha subunit
VTDLTPVPGQTIGPFFGYALPYPGGPELVPAGTPGAIRLHGRVLDGLGQPVPDAMLELWQPAPDGSAVQEPGSLRRDGWTFTGWGRASTDNSGRYSFTTLTPGAADGGRVAFFSLVVFARGLLDRLFTRAYLPAESPEQADALDRDALLRALPEDRRGTLVARRDDTGYVFDVVLQGEDETVFLTYPRHPLR